MSSCLLDLKPSQENSLDRSNNLSYSHIERPSSRSPINSRISYAPKCNEEYRFSKKDKENDALKRENKKREIFAKRKQEEVIAMQQRQKLD